MWINLATVAVLYCAQIVFGVILEDVLTAKRKNDYLKRCLLNLSELYFAPQEHIFYSHWNLNVSDFMELGARYQTQAYNRKAQQMIPNNFVQFSAYVIVVTRAEFEANLDALASMARWNSRAKFVIILEGLVSTEIWRKLASYYVVNAIVIQTEDLQLFTYFPYKYENLRFPDLETVNLGSCWDFDVSNGFAYSNKVPKQWRNTTIIVAYMPLHPYILDVKEGTGIEVELVELMSGFMKYNVSYSTKKYLDWGVYYPKNSSYSGPVSAIQRYEADFVIGHFHLREVERITDFDTTFSYMDDDICWIVPIALIRSHWQNIMHIFNYSTWWCTIIAMFSSYVAWQFFNWRSPYILPAAYQYYRNPLCSMEVPFLNFLGLPIRHVPKSWATRFLFLVIFVFCFILVTGWKSYLILSLTHDTSEYQIQNLKDVVKNDLTVGIYHELIDLNCAEGTPEGDYVCQHADRTLCDASHRCLNRVAYQRDLCTIATKRIYRYMSPQLYRTPSGREMLYMLKKCLGKDYTVQYYTKGHPLFERSNDLLVWIRTGGFVDNLDNRLDHKIELSFQAYMKGRSMFDLKVLGLTEVQGMFYLLLGGLFTSLVVFFFELIIYKNRCWVQIHRTRLQRFMNRSYLW